MASFYLFLIYNLFFSSFFNSIYSKTLILPLKIQQIPSGSGPKPPNKLSFNHNVSLTVALAVGTPPQQVVVVLDTGSELTWLRCKQTPTTPLWFDPLNSTSYTPVVCSHPTCTTRIVFGCMDTGSSSDPDEDSKSTGLLGMNRGSLSFVTQMGYPKFSYCISGRDSTGVLVFGEVNVSWLEPLSYTPLVNISTPLPYFDRVAYTVQLEGIKVSETVLGLPKSVYEPDHTGAGQTMVDSGTQFTFLLGPVYTALRNEYLNQTKAVLRVYEDADFVFQGAMDLCYRIDPTRGGLPVLPSVTMMFRGAQMSVSGEKLLVRVPGLIKGNDEIHCFTFGNSDLLGIEAYVIGHHHQQNMWMEFDLANSRVGLAEVRCDLASQNLGVGL
ncbi:putative nepenthesin [Helianthus annuus]|nr:putative nepenthesin [Helianthus annuus]